MSEYLLDAGHRTMRTCDGCGGAFYCGGTKGQDDDTDAPDWTCEMCTAKDAEIARLRAALRPFAEFARRFNLKPIPNTERTDILYGIHAGEKDLEADVRLSHCRAALKALEGT